jgi:hypothetical protein
VITLSGLNSTVIKEIVNTFFVKTASSVKQGQHLPVNEPETEVKIDVEKHDEKVMLEKTMRRFGFPW